MPSMKVDGDSDGDAEMSGNESERSAGSSRCPDRETSAEEADEPDSDDSSEMDESECERRRNDCLENIADLERQFLVLREQLYRERISQVDFQLAEVKGGRSPEYLGPLKELQENMRIRIEVAGVLRTLRRDNIKHQFEAEEQAALQHFESEKWLAWEHLNEELLDKVRRLEEDRHASDVTSLRYGITCNTPREGRSSRRKPVTLSPPYVIYMLSDQDIMEDWRIIRKALKRSES